MKMANSSIDLNCIRCKCAIYNAASKKTFLIKLKMDVYYYQYIFLSLSPFLNGCSSINDPNDITSIIRENEIKMETKQKKYSFNNNHKYYDY